MGAGTMKAPPACHNCGEWLEPTEWYFCEKCRTAMGYSEKSFADRCRPVLVQARCIPWDREQERHADLSHGSMQMADGSICDYSTPSERLKLERINSVHAGFNHLTQIGETMIKEAL